MGLDSNLFPAHHKGQYKPLPLISPNHLRLIREPVCVKLVSESSLRKNFPYLERMQRRFPFQSAVLRFTSPSPISSFGKFGGYIAE